MKAYFFAPERPHRLGLMRIGLGLVLLYDAQAHWPRAVELYSSFGTPMPLAPGTAFEPPARAAGWTVALATWLLFALAAVVLGWWTRTSLLTALVLSAWFALLDSPATLTKYTVIGLHLLALLACADAGACWSLDAAVRRPLAAPRPSTEQPVDLRETPAWPRRLMQILLCSVYWGAAITKLRLTDFATGDLLMYSLLDDRWGGGTLGLWLSTQPKLLALASLGTIFFEILFPALVWVPRCRRWMLACAAAFHLAIAVTMTVGIFSPLMLTALLAFAEEEDLARIRQLAGRLALRSDGTPEGRVPHALGSFSAYAVGAAAVVAIGCAVQWQADWYGAFGRREFAPLAALPAAEVEEMRLAQLPPLEDYFHRVDIGSRVANFHTFGARRVFRPGMRVHLLARLVQNHPPLTTDVLLTAPDGTVVARSTHRLESPFSYLLVPIELTDTLPAGTYRLILRAEGIEVARRRFQLVRE